MDRMLKLIEEHANLSCADLSAMLGMPENEVQEQKLRYEREGVIRGYRAVIDWEKAGRDYVSAIIQLKVSPKPDQGFDEIAQKIMSFSEVDSVYLMSGGYDLTVMITAPTFKEVAMFVAQSLAPLESVLSTATHFILKRYKDRGVDLTSG